VSAGVVGLVRELLGVNTLHLLCGVTACMGPPTHVTGIDWRLACAKDITGAGVVGGVERRHEYVYQYASVNLVYD
jgi:hypothetical protein